MHVVAVDAGTSVVKALRYEGDRVAATARRRVPVQRSNGTWAEQQPEHVWAAVAAVLREVATDQVEQLSVTAQGDGCWLLDEAGEPTGPAVLWSDGRAHGIVERWRNQGRAEAAHQLNGMLLFPGSSAPIISWFREHEPRRLVAGGTVTTCGGWLAHRLTGARQVEWSDATHPFAKVTAPEYDPALLSLFDLGDVAGMLPDVVRSADSARPLSAAAAAQVGLSSGIPVVQAPYDVPASALGSGCAAPGASFAVLGTALVCGTLAGSPQEVTAAETIAFGVEDLVLGIHPTLAGMELLTWGASLLGVPDAGAVMELARHSAPGAAGMLTLPYFSPAGERAPFVSSGPRGALMGLGYGAGRQDLARSLVESLALVVRDCLGLVEGPVSLCGGGASSDLWCQTIADVLGVSVQREAGLEAGARGAWLAGRLAAGDLASADLATSARTTGSTFDPDPANVSTYEDLYQRFRAARECLTETSETTPEPGGPGGTTAERREAR